MRLNLKKTVVAASLVFGVIPVAYAVWPVTDATLIQITQTMSSSVTQLLGQILQQLKQLTAEQSTSATKISETMSQSSDNAIQRGVDTQKEISSQNATRNTKTPIDPCANGARGISDPNFDRAQPGYSSGGIQPRFGGGPSTSNMPTTGSGSLDKAIKISGGLMSVPTPENQALLAQEGACSVYAAGQRSASCKASGTATGSVVFPNADVRADTLFDGAQTAADTGKISQVFSQAQIAAATAYLRNISNPIALRELTTAESKTDEGKKYFALRDAHAARLDLATRPAIEWLNNKTKYKATIPVLQAMIDGQGAAAKYLQTQLPIVAPDWKSEGISIHQLMAFEAARRYQNAEWIKEIAQTSDPLTLQREQLMVSALTVDLATKQLLETQKSNMMLGAIYQASLNKDFMPEVIAAHKRATAAR